jgi:hypothetical protein
MVGLLQLIERSNKPLGGKMEQKLVDSDADMAMEHESETVIAELPPTVLESVAGGRHITGIILIDK